MSCRIKITNSATTTYSSVVGGISNLNSATHAFIGGGSGNTINSTAISSSILAGNNITITEPNTAAFSNGRAINNLSATTYYSGSTDISTLFVTLAQ